MDPVTATTVDGLNLFGMLAAVLWHVLRVGAALQVLPMIGGRTLPVRARMILALALSAAISTLLPDPPPAAVDAATVLNVLREFAVGIAIGLVLRLAFEAGQFARSRDLALLTGLPQPLLGRLLGLVFLVALCHLPISRGCTWIGKSGGQCARRQESVLEQPLHRLLQFPCQQ